MRRHLYGRRSTYKRARTDHSRTDLRTMEENSLISRSGVRSRQLRPPRKIIPACARQTDLFYGNYSDLREEPQEEKTIREWQAKSVCSQCEMILPCRTFALINGEEYGVWGGMTPGERREFLKWYKRFYTHVALNNEKVIDVLIERWRDRYRKKQTKKEATLPRHYARSRSVSNPNRYRRSAEQQSGSGTQRQHDSQTG